MRLSTKGQLTIPEQIREQAGIGPGSAVDVVYPDGNICCLRAADGGASTPGQRAVSALRAGRGKPSMTTEQLMALTRGWGEPDEDRAHGIRG